MKFKKRVSKFPARRLLYKLDSMGKRVEEPAVVEIVRE